MKGAPIELSTRSRKNPVGRPAGSRATSKQEDATIVKVFKKLRPPGCGIVARQVRAGLPAKLKRKISERTVIRRLFDKGWKAQPKLKKSAQSIKQAKIRLKFCKKLQDKTAQEWRRELQGVGDIKEFTWYPHDLRPRLKQLRASWTYMTDKEKYKAAFLLPKRWFPKADWKRVKKQKIFGLTTSNGKSLAVPCPMPMTGEKFAELVTQKLKPFLKRTFPKMKSYQILLDGEKIFRSPVAKAALAAASIKVFPNWPAYSPELNPQENVWPWAENRLRALEGKRGSFEDFAATCVKAVSAYPFGQSLIDGMPKRMEKCVAAKGGTIMM